MNVTGRITAWLIPSILLWGGCAAPTLLKPAASADVSKADRTESQQLVEGMQPPPMVVAEAALIRETALARGYSETEARQFEQSIINARTKDRQFLMRFIYAQLNRHAEPGASNSDSTPALPEPAMPSPDSAYVVSRAAVGSPSPDASSEVRTASHTAPLQRPTDQLATSSATATSTAEEASKRSSDQRVSDSPQPAADSPTASASSTTGHDRTSGLAENDTRAARDTNQTQSPAAANRQARLEVGTNQESAASENSSPDDTRISWQRQLRLAITRLRRDLAENEELDKVDESRLRACLGLLQLAAEDPERAMEALEGLDDQQLEFWRQTIMGLDILMDSDELPKMRYRVETAAEHLQSGLSTLATLGPLRVNNLAFVSGVRSFGVYDEISSRGFEPGEEAILYVEIGNFTVEEIAVDQSDRTSSRRRQAATTQVPMYETELLGRYDILDQNQRIVMSRTLPVIRDRCRQHRRDFFIAYEFYMPKEIAAGHFTLELTIEDRKGDKFGSGTIDLRIR